MRLMDMRKIKRRPITLDERACIGLDDCAVFFAMGVKKFRKVFFETNLCDLIPYTLTPKGGVMLSLTSSIEVAFPDLDSQARAVFLYAHLRDRRSQRVASSLRRADTIERRGMSNEGVS